MSDNDLGLLDQVRSHLRKSKNRPPPHVWALLKSFEQQVLGVAGRLSSKQRSLLYYYRRRPDVPWSTKPRPDRTPVILRDLPKKPVPHDFGEYE